MVERRETTTTGGAQGRSALTIALALLIVLVIFVAVATATEAAPTNALPGLTVSTTVGVGRHPEGVAIDSALGLAVVTNHNAGSVSLVSLTSRAVIGNVAVGLQPVAVAVNPVTGVAVVANAGSHTVTLVDLRARAATRAISVGRRPVAVGVDPVRNIAIVANQNSDDVSVIDVLTGTVVGTVRVGRHPSGVALNPAAGLAAVTNREDDTVTLVDLEARAATAVIPIDPGRLGRQRLSPTGIAWDTVLGTLAVANADDWSVTLLDLDGRRVVGRARVAAGKRPVGVAASSGNNLVLVTSDQDDVIALDPSTASLLAQTSVGKHPRGVALAPGGDTGCTAVVTNRDDDSISLLGARCSALGLIALDPPAVTAGAPALPLTLFGAGFVPGTVVNVGGFAQPLTPSVVTATRISVRLPGAYLAVPQTLPISVTLPSGVRSNALPLTVSAVPPPRLTALLPADGVANFQDLPFTVLGSGFLPGATIVFDDQRLPAVVDSAGQAHATVPAALLVDGRPIAVTVENPGGVASNPLPFALVNPVPVLSELTPNNVVRGSADTEIVLLGAQFVLGSQVYFCPSATSPRALCTLIPSTPFAGNPPVQINARIPAALLTTEGVYAIRVFNPAPGGGETFNQPFTVTTAVLPPGYTMTVFSLTAGHPEHVALVAPGLAAVAVPSRGQIQLVDLVAKRLDALLTLTSATSGGLLGALDADAATGSFVVSVPFRDEVRIVQLDRLNPAASLVAAVPLPAGAFPFGVAVNPITHQAIVTNIVGGSVSVVDLPTRRLVATINLPGAQNPAFVAVNTVTNVAVVVDQGDFASPGQVYLVDVDRARVTGTLTVGVAPSQVAVNPFTGRAVVSNSYDDTVSILDITGRGSVVATIAVGQEPTGVAIDVGSNRAMVANTQDNKVMLIDLGTSTITTVLQLGADGAVAPSELAWDTGARTAIATNASIGVFTNNLMLLTLP
jgi:YVTN family beta-propeller protein